MANSAEIIFASLPNPHVSEAVAAEIAGRSAVRVYAEMSTIGHESMERIAALLAARNGMYGLALNPMIRGGRRRRLLAAQLVIDESSAMASAQRDAAEAAKAFWVTGIGVFAFWNLGTLIGAVAGNAIGDPETLGLDAAFPAGFIALTAPHLRRRPGLIAAIVGGAIAFVTIPLLPAGAPVLVAALAVIPAFAVQRRETA